MKKTMKAWLLTILSVLAIIPLSLSSVQASASVNIGTPVEQLTSKAWGKYYQYSYSDSSGKQRLFYGEYKPTSTSDYEFVVHTKGSLATVANIAKDYTQKTGKAVKMAINGDFFQTASGISTPIDSMVVDGEVQFQGAYSNKNAMGFDNNGGVAIGRMLYVKDILRVKVGKKTYQFPVDGLNVEPDEGELSVFTTATNRVIKNACKYVITTEEDVVTKRPIVGTSRRMTTGTVVDDKAFTCNAGQFAIVVKGENKLSKFMYNCIQYGTEVSIVRAPAGAYDGMQYVVGGWDILVKDGVVQTSTHSTASDPNGGGSNAPRTMLGMKADGTMFCAVLDGRQSSWSVGCTVQEEADLAKTLGAEFALELDGGGSSTFLYDKGNGLEKLNKPSDGSDRAVYNAVLLVEKGESKTFYTLDDYKVPGEENSDSSETSSEDVSVEDSSEEISVENSSEDVSVENSSEDVIESTTGDSVVENTSSEEKKVQGCGGTVSSIGILLAGCFVCATAIMKKRNN